MNKFYIIALLAIGSVCIQLSNGATTSSPSATTRSQTEAEMELTTSGVTASTPADVTEVITEVLNNVTFCPRFATRLENETLYITYVEGRCEMVVTVETLTLPPLRIVKMFKRGGRVIRRPVVSFRPVNVEQNGEPVSCESLPNRSLGPFVFVDTVVGECQMLLKIQREINRAFMPRLPGRQKGWVPGKRLEKRPRNPWFTFVPAYEYLDEIVY